MPKLVRELAASNLIKTLERMDLFKPQKKNPEEILLSAINHLKGCTKEFLSTDLDPYRKNN